MAVYNHWTGLVDWIGGLITFMLPKQTHLHTGSCTMRYNNPET